MKRKWWFLLLVVWLAACNGEAEATPTTLATLAPVAVLPSPTNTLPPTNTPIPPTSTLAVNVQTAHTAVPTNTRAPLQPTFTVPPVPTSTPRPTETPTPAPVPTIRQFSVSAVESSEGGKDVTFTWASSGGATAQIVLGTSLRFAPFWNVDPSGTMTVHVSGTIYQNPIATLTLRDEAGREATASETITWACQYDYFFEPGPAACPLAPPSNTAAAEQLFQDGRMIWLQQVDAPGTTYRNWILVLYEDGSWSRFQDTWSSNEPEDDPNITPPREGLRQPVRGFGKLWREDDVVRSKLRWATDQERGYAASWQWETRESIPGIAYLQMRDGRIVQLIGDTAGTWSYYEPADG